MARSRGNHSGFVFVPSFWVWIVYCATVLSALWWMRTYPQSEITQDGFVSLLYIGGVAVASWMVAQLCWIISNQTHGIFNFIQLGLMGCGLLGLLIVARDLQFQHDDQIDRQNHERRLALSRRAIARAQAEYDDTVDRWERFKKDRFVRYEDQVPEDALNQIRQADAEIVESIDVARERYESILENNPTDRPESWSRISTLDELEVERSYNIAVYEATRSYNDFLDGLEETYQSKVDSMELEPEFRKIAVAEMARFLQTWEYSGAHEYRRLDVEICGVAIKALELLRDGWGEWHYDQASSRIRFDSPDLEFRFSQLANEANLMLREQDKVRRHMEDFFR